MGFVPSRFPVLFVIYSAVRNAKSSSDSDVISLNLATLLSSNDSASSNNSNSTDAEREAALERAYKPKQHCSLVNKYDRATKEYGFMHACSWYRGDKGWNMFFMRKDRTVLYERWCDNELASYDPWDTKYWSYLHGLPVACWSWTDSTEARYLTRQFDWISCGAYDSGLKFGDSATSERAIF